MTHLIPLGQKWQKIYWQQFKKKSSPKTVWFWSFFHLSLLLGVWLKRWHYWFRLWFRTEQATSHYLNQGWPSSAMHKCSTRGRLAKSWLTNKDSYTITRREMSKWIPTSTLYTSNTDQLIAFDAFGYNKAVVCIPFLFICSDGMIYKVNVAQML